jgi:hypothetical protein
MKTAVSTVKKRRLKHSTLILFFKHFLLQVSVKKAPNWARLGSCTNAPFKRSLQDGSFPETQDNFIISD